MIEGDDASRAAGERASRSGAPAPPSVRDGWSASTDDRCRAIIEAADDAILVADFDSRLVCEANPAACELFGFKLSELRDLPVTRLLVADSADVAAVLNELAERERAWHPNLRSVRKDGSSFWGELRAKAFESGGSKLVLLIVRDVTQRVEKDSELAQAHQTLEATQASLVHAGKLAAIGQIAGGVAHEVNNPATFMLTNLRAMRDRVALLRRSVSTLRRELSTAEITPPSKRAAVEEIFGGSAGLDPVLRETSEMVEDNLAGIERIASIVNDLRVFSRIEPDDVCSVDVNGIVEAACNLAFADIRHRARLVKEISRLPPVKAEPGKLAQVFTSLLLGAAQSIEEGAANDNEIRVATYVEAGFVVVAIRDTGPGMTEEARARLFEPFHTSGSGAHGAGLGLSLSAEIVQLLGGSIQVSPVESAAGRGTRFEVRLPAIAEEAPSRAEETSDGVPAPLTATPASGRRARVLVIDDDLAVLRAYRRMLFSRHDVVLAGGGAAGLELLQKDDAFDIILCDVMMPQVDGPMVYEALRARAPEVAERLVFCSGGAFTPRAKEFLGSIRNAFLEKPIDVEALEVAILQAKERRILAAAQG